MRRRRSQGRKTTETRTTDNLSLPDSVIDTRQVGSQVLGISMKSVVGYEQRFVLNLYIFYMPIIEG